VSQINVVGVLTTFKHAVLAFRKRGGGTFIVSGSTAGSVNQNGSIAISAMMGPMSSSLLAYSASKAAIHSFVQTSSGCYVQDNIQVFGLSICAFASEISARIGGRIGSHLGGFNPYFKDTEGNAADISKVVLAILDGTSKYTNGSLIVIDHDATCNAKIFYDKLFAPGPVESFGWLAPEQLKPLLRDVSGATPYFPPDEQPTDSREYLQKQGIRETLQSALSKIIQEKPADAAARLVELLSTN